MKKRFLAAVLAGMMVLSLAACGGKKEETKAEETKAETKAEETKAEETKAEETKGTEAADSSEPKKIVFCKAYANIDENNQRGENAIQELIKEINAEGKYEIEYYYTDSQSQVDKQITDVESLLQYKPDVILISSVDTVGSIPALQAAKAAGAFVIEDRGAEDESIDAHFYGSNEDAIAARIEQSVKDYLDANPDLNLKVGLCYGLASQVEQLKRCDIIKEMDTDPEYGDRIEIVAEQYCDWSTDKATAAVEDWMIKYPDLNCVITASDDMGLGACNALTAAGKKDIYVGAVDGTAIGVELCKTSPQYYVTISMSQMGMQTALMNDLVIGAVEGTFTGGDYYCDESCFKTLNRETIADYVVD